MIHLSGIFVEMLYYSCGKENLYILLRFLEVEVFKWIYFLNSVFYIEIYLFKCLFKIKV